MCGCLGVCGCVRACVYVCMCVSSVGGKRGEIYGTGVTSTIIHPHQHVASHCVNVHHTNLMRRGDVVSTDPDPVASSDADSCTPSSLAVRSVFMMANLIGELLS